MHIPTFSLDPSPLVGNMKSDRSKPQKTGFVKSLSDAIDATNKMIEDANKTSLELAEGKSGNIHEAMIKMQKADIMLRLLVASTNKLINGYNELMRLR